MLPLVALPVAGGGEVWVLPVPPPGTATEAGHPFLDDEEQSRASAFVRAEDRARFAFAHVTLRQLLGARLGLSPAELRFGRDRCPCCGGPHGRPVVLPRAPLEFSLSHGGDLVVIGIASSPIGVDVEPVPEGPGSLEVARQLHPEERRHIDANGPAAPLELARLWARKEALLKGMGAGLGRDLSADDVTRSVPGWEITDLPVPPGHAAAAAVQTVAL